MSPARGALRTVRQCVGRGGAEQCAAHVFAWSGANRQFVCSDGDKLVIGAGGSCGLMLDSTLRRGTSGRCDTFGNLPLPLAAATPLGAPLPAADDEVPPHEFVCETLELWSVDEHACRRLPSCKRHVRLRDGDGAPAEAADEDSSPGRTSSPRRSGYSVSSFFSPPGR